VQERTDGKGEKRDRANTIGLLQAQMGGTRKGVTRLTMKGFVEKKERFAYVFIESGRG